MPVSCSGKVLFIESAVRKQQLLTEDALKGPNSERMLPLKGQSVSQNGTSLSTIESQVTEKCCSRKMLFIKSAVMKQQLLTECDLKGPNSERKVAFKGLNIVSKGRCTSLERS